MKLSQKTIFITGANGLVGSYLLKIFLKNKYKIFCLVRGGDHSNAESRLLRSLQLWDRNIEKKDLTGLIVCKGDISKENLGLNEGDSKILKNEINEIFHCAALTEFDANLDTLKSVNVLGTENVLLFALECKRSPRVSHLSSIYVCGNYAGIFSEENFDVNQGFEIFYERSKFEAEKLVYKYRNKGVSVNVFRSPAIVGESYSGKILSFNQAFYQGLRILNRGIFDYLPCRNAFLNVVFVDELCEAIYLLTQKISSNNDCYHVFKEEGVSIEKTLTLASEFLNIKPPAFVLASDFERKSTPIQKSILRHNFSFLSRNIVFESKKTNMLLNSLNFKFSSFNRENLLKLIMYAEKQGFLKKNK